MRRRSIGILLAGALLSALPWLVVARVIARHQAVQHLSRADWIHSQLCLALTAAAVELDAGASGSGGRTGSGSEPLLAALRLRRINGTTLHPPGPKPQATAARRPRPGDGGFRCQQASTLAALKLSAAAGDPDLLLIQRAAGRTNAATAELGLDTRALLMEEGLVRIQTPTSAGSVAPRPQSQELDVAGNTLQISLTASPSGWEPWQSLALARALAGGGLLLTSALAVRSETEGRRQRRRLESLRHDGQSGLLSRLALEEDLCERSPEGQELPEALLVIVNLRLLQRQGPFRRDEEIRELFNSLGAAVNGLERVDSEPRLYRASENRLALVLRIPPQDDERLLAELEQRIGRVLHGWTGVSPRPDDLLITAQRLSLGPGAAGRLDLHGYGEILARDAGVSLRLIEDQDRQRVLEEAAIRDHLQTLGAEDIRLVFQPILLLASPGQVALEALVRFLPDRLRPVPTGRLLAIAHDLGIAHRIDALVLGKIPGLLQSLRDSPGLNQRISSIALNISGDSFASPARLDALIRQLEELAIDPARFSLEFTETPFSDKLGDTAAVTIASERLTRELKLRIAIDDFGSGLSNYRRICEAWYDTLKLDIGLVAGIGSSFRMQRYVGSLIETVHSLGKTVVCEGVENHADLTAAVRLGADGVQGYLIARPMDWQALEVFLERSEWASPQRITALLAEIRQSDRQVLPDPGGSGATEAAVPLERQILDNWFELRSFEEFLLLFVNELKRWGLDILRLSLAFLPDQDDIDCSQYVWLPSSPAEVRSLRMDRAFLQNEEHLSSALHHIATETRFYRRRLASSREVDFSFLRQLKEQGCNDYLGLRLDSRGISIPVLTIALRGESSFSDEQIQRIVSMSSLLSLLFHSFESERAKRLALLDPLTDLPNRRSFDSFLGSNIQAARLSGSSLALALIDIDRFKQVNDSLGHGYGDACLRELASILGADLRQGRDFAARLGGEEFALILPETTAAEAMRLGETLRQAVARARVVAGDGRASLPLTISLGIAVWDPRGVAAGESDRLLQLADDCLYEAKRKGRNRLVCRLLES